jgi:hypothetical protein
MHLILTTRTVRVPVRVPVRVRVRVRVGNRPIKAL